MEKVIRRNDGVFIFYISHRSHMTVRYIKYVANIFGLDKMSSDAVYSNLLCDFVISSAIYYKKIGSVKLGSV